MTNEMIIRGWNDSPLKGCPNVLLGFSKGFQLGQKDKVELSFLS